MSRIRKSRDRADLKMDFGHFPEDLADLFDLDEIRNGGSKAKVDEWGGLDSFESSLITRLKSGISRNPDDHKRRVLQFGDNKPIVKKPKTIWELILENFEDEMLRILCGAALVSLVLGIATEGLREGWLEGTSILMAVVIIVSVTSFNNYMKEKQFQKLNKIAEQKNVNVVRGGQLENVSIFDLMVGDVLEFETGDKMSADAILIHGFDVKADESAMTGESDAITKNEERPFILSGSNIIQGTGTVMILAVGKNSFAGKLKLRIQKDQDETPLQGKLSVLADKVGDVGMFAAIATFSAMLLHHLVSCLTSPSFFKALFSFHTLDQIIQYFIIGVSIVVVAIPEGLPLAVTIALAYSVGKMKDENNLVRFLQACETMGGANNICTDKTGTLTKNQMTVTRIFVEEKVSNQIDSQAMSENTRNLLTLTAIANSNANPKITGQPGSAKIQAEQIGNKTECAILEMVYILGTDFKKARDKNKIVKSFPFSSAKKKMTTLYTEGKSTFICCKGAPDFLLEKCTKYIDKNGKIATLTPEFEEKIHTTISSFANESLRTILLAYREISNEIKIVDDQDYYDKDLIMIAIVGIKDPLRDEIPDAVELCHNAGITVRMVTGDNIQTAIAIAKEAGILNREWSAENADSEFTVMEGKAFREYVEGLVEEGQEGEESEKTERVGNLENFKKVAEQLRVLARSSPDDKYLLATGLKELDNVVAMTGDGSNDAPALKKADIGFAMGIAGTDVAKDASGIILLDDNFKSIVTAVKWGRNIFDCIRKFLQFQLTINFVALVMAFVGGAVLRESPLNAIQMLWVNLIMDTLASLALATEPPSEELLKRKPYSRFENLITTNMWVNIISQGLLQILILGTILFKGPDILGIPSSIGVGGWNEDSGRHYAIFFNVFVFLQLFNQINARKLEKNEINVFKNFFNNPLFLIILIATFLIQISLAQFGGEAVKTIPLTALEIFICLIIGSSSLFFGFVFKTLIPSHIHVSKQGIEIGSFHYYWKGQRPQRPKEVEEVADEGESAPKAD